MSVSLVSADRCPDCSAIWRPSGSETTRLVGIYDRDADRTVEWCCPDCGARWPRGATIEAS